MCHKCTKKKNAIKGDRLNFSLNRQKVYFMGIRIRKFIIDKHNSLTIKCSCLFIDHPGNLLNYFDVIMIDIIDIKLNSNDILVLYR